MREEKRTLIIEIFRIEPHLKNGLRYIQAQSFQECFGCLNVKTLILTCERTDENV